MGNHRFDKVTDIPKQFGNPSANRSETISVAPASSDDNAWLNATPIPLGSGPLASDGMLFKVRDRLRAKADECKGRIVKAAQRMELAMEAKTAFMERYAEKAEAEYKETVDFYNSLGA